MLCTTCWLDLVSEYPDDDVETEPLRDWVGIRPTGFTEAELRPSLRAKRGARRLCRACPRLREDRRDDGGAFAPGSYARRYLAEIRFLDQQVARLRAGLSELGREPDLRADRRVLVGLAIVLMGTAVLTQPWATDGWNRGDLLTLGAALAFAFFVVLVGISVRALISAYWRTPVWISIWH